MKIFNYLSDSIPPLKISRYVMKQYLQKNRLFRSFIKSKKFWNFSFLKKSDFFLLFSSFSIKTVLAQFEIRGLVVLDCPNKFQDKFMTVRVQAWRHENFQNFNSDVRTFKLKNRIFILNEARGYGLTEFIQLSRFLIGLNLAQNLNLCFGEK